MTPALENRPLALGMPIRWLTLAPPPDWPTISTRFGSPPNASTLRDTHCRAATKSWMPAAPESAKSPSSPR